MTPTDVVVEKAARILASSQSDEWLESTSVAGCTLQCTAVDGWMSFQFYRSDPTEPIYIVVGASGSPRSNLLPVLPDKPVPAHATSPFLQTIFLTWLHAVDQR
jgi:hypothetical protein